MKKRIFSLGIVAMMIASAPVNDCVYAEVVSALEQNVYEVSEQTEYTYSDYVVDLLNQMGVTTTEDDWESNLSYLEDNYEEIREISGVKMNLVDYYISEYSSQAEYEKYISQQKNFVQSDGDVIRTNSTLGSIATYSTNTTSSFKPVLAVQYAREYYNKFNPAYPNWSGYGGDCANFVSQCLVAGGRAMESGNSNSALNWYSYGNACDTTRVSSSFRGANAFKNYFMVRAKSSLKVNKGVTKGYLYNEANLGDAVSFCIKNSSGTPIAYHTMIVVGKEYSSQTVYLAGHTDPVVDRSFYDTLNKYDCCYIFSMYK